MSADDWTTAGILGYLVFLGILSLPWLFTPSARYRERKRPGPGARGDA